MRAPLLLVGLLALFGTILASPPAHAFVPSGQCAVIVAARQTLADVDAFVERNPQISIEKVYRARNGWYAISTGLVANDVSARHIARRIARGEIPPDSYCSNGDAYLAIVRQSGQSSDRTTMRSFSSDPFADFDARPLTQGEKKLLQAALALEGYYLGILDGKWGRRSQEAFDRYSWDIYNEKPQNGHAAVLAIDALEELENGGWQPRFFPALNLSLYAPLTRLHLDEVDGSFESYVDLETGVELVVFPLSAQDTGQIHSDILRDHAGPDEPYTLRKAGLWITSISAGSYRGYLRSNYDHRGRTWVSVLVEWSATPAASGQANLMVASIAEGRMSAIRLPTAGHLERIATRLIAMIEEAERSSPTPNTDDAKPPRNAGTGTGFYVARAGVALTNAHVVEGCRAIQLDEAPANIIGQSRDFDIAVLQRRDEHTPAGWLAFSNAPAELNSDITIAGYPLYGLLGGLNITRGTVSSLQGLQGDTVTMQISAPVQPGNSGGPVVNAQGEVVGVVVSKLDSIAVAGAIGDIPQNVNFAIRAEFAQAILAANGVRIASPTSSRSLSPVDLAARLEDATVLVECLK